MTKSTINEILPSFRTCHTDCEYVRAISQGDLNMSVLSKDISKERLLAAKKTPSRASNVLSRFYARLIDQPPRP